MTTPAQVSRLLSELADSLSRETSLRALYAVGSLAGGDYVPGVSDLDMVAVLAATLDPAQGSNVGAMHRRLRRDYGSAAKLHCRYVVDTELDDWARDHPAWDGRRFRSGPLTGVARVELLRGGLVISGPLPGELIPGVDDDQLRAAVRAELTGYRSTATTWRLPWLRDLYVDLGLLTLPRAAAALDSGALISNREALDQLGRVRRASRSDRRDSRATEGGSVSASARCGGLVGPAALDASSGSALLGYSRPTNPTANSGDRAWPVDHGGSAADRSDLQRDPATTRQLLRRSTSASDAGLSRKRRRSFDGESGWVRPCTAGRCAGPATALAVRGDAGPVAPAEVSPPSVPRLTP